MHTSFGGPQREISSFLFPSQSRAQCCAREFCCKILFPSPPFVRWRRAVHPCSHPSLGVRFLSFFLHRQKNFTTKLPRTTLGTGLARTKQKAAHVHVHDMPMSCSCACALQGLPTRKLIAAQLRPRPAMDRLPASSSLSAWARNHANVLTYASVRFGWPLVGSQPESGYSPDTT